MSVNATIDSNVLIYAFSKQQDSKKSVAKKIILNCSVINLQAVNETIYVLHRKFNFSFDELIKIIHFMDENFIIKKLDLISLKKAMVLMKKYKYSYWDSMMLAASLENGCTKLYSEDMQNGQIIEDRLIIVNPFEETK